MYLPNYAIADIAPSQTDSSLVTKKVGFVNRVIGGFVVAAGTATTIVLNSKGTGSGTAITSTLFCGANGGICWPIAANERIGDPPFGYFESIRGEGITATTGSGTTVGVTLVYIQIS